MYPRLLICQRLRLSSYNDMGTLLPLIIYLKKARMRRKNRLLVHLLSSEGMMKVSGERSAIFLISA